MKNVNQAMAVNLASVALIAAVAILSAVQIGAIAVRFAESR